MSAAARSAASGDLLERIGDALVRGSSAARCMLAWPWMTVRMLLKSCATPAANWPTASSFCEWRSCFSRLRCSLTSSVAIKRDRFRAEIERLPPRRRIRERSPKRRAQLAFEIPHRALRRAACASSRHASSGSGQRSSSRGVRLMISSRRKPVIVEKGVVHIEEALGRERLDGHRDGLAWKALAKRSSERRSSFSACSRSAISWRSRRIGGLQFLGAARRRFRRGRRGGIAADG